MTTQHWYDNLGRPGRYNQVAVDGLSLPGGLQEPLNVQIFVGKKDRLPECVPSAVLDALFAATAYQLTHLRPADLDDLFQNTELVVSNGGEKITAARYQSWLNNTHRVVNLYITHKWETARYLGTAEVASIINNEITFQPTNVMCTTCYRPYT